MFWWIFFQYDKVCGLCSFLFPWMLRRSLSLLFCIYMSGHITILSVSPCWFIRKSICVFICNNLSTYNYACTEVTKSATFSYKHLSSLYSITFDLTCLRLSPPLVLLSTKWNQPTSSHFLLFSVLFSFDLQGNEDEQ